jgi:8-oxo-dGTP pyrophosphatase MutT (NUDIX family)
MNTAALPTTFNKTKSAITHAVTGVQCAALPFRIDSGNLQILLITSRETGRWVIPKGWPTRGLRPREVAAREALEEAGLIGRIVGKRSIGSYHYTKRLPDNRETLCRVKVFLLSVDHQLDDWPEKAQRECRWVAPQMAAHMVDEGGLSEILRAAFPAVQFQGPKARKRRRFPR